MPNILVRIVLAVLLVVAALACWGEATRLEATADTWQQLVSLSNDVPEPPPASRWTRFVPASLRGSELAAPRQKATADYWLSRYEELVRTRGGDPDPAVMLTAANAAYREARASGEFGAVAAKQLDGVLEAYGNVLKADPSAEDAAWNFEFVSRARDIVARMRNAPKGKALPPVIGLSPPPVGLSVHGVPGGPPPEVKGETFETIAPMDFGDREAQPEATPGVAIKRKG